jgi:hypothetical protein
MTQALGVVVTFLLYAVSVTMPSTLVLVDARRGRNSAWLMMAVYGGVCYALAGPGFAAWMIAAFVAPGVGLSVGFRKSPRVNWVFVAGFGAAVFCLFLYYAIAVVGMEFLPRDLEVFQKLFRAGMKESFATYGLSGEQLKQLPGGPDAFFRWVFLLAPALAVSGGALLVWMNMLICVRVGAGGKPFRGSSDLSEWSAPEYLVFGTLAPAVVITMVKQEWALALAGNLLLVFMIPFFFQGMAIASHTLHRFHFSPGMRFITYAMIFGIFGGMVLPAMAAMGVIDIWLDFRRLRKPKKTEAPEPEDEEGEF